MKVEKARSRYFGSQQIGVKHELDVFIRTKRNEWLFLAPAIACSRREAILISRRRNFQEGLVSGR